MNTVKHLNIVACLLGVIAFSSCVGFELENKIGNGLFVFGQAVGFSPMPLPFREFSSGDENMSVHFSGTLTLATSSQTIAISQQGSVDNLHLHDRPHRAAIPFYTIVGYFPVIPEPIKYFGMRYLCLLYGGKKMDLNIMYSDRMYTYPVICTL